VWQYVVPHFTNFLANLELSTEDRNNAEGKAQRVARSLFARYYPEHKIFDPRCYVEVGSYGKGTACSVSTDLDMLFILPNDLYSRINGLSGNKQSQLLQQVKGPFIRDLSTDERPCRGTNHRAALRDLSC
jgi:hypothetical protein